MLRLGPSPVPRHNNPEQETLLWRQRCHKEEPQSVVQGRTTARDVVHQDQSVVSCNTMLPNSTLNSAKTNLTHRTPLVPRPNKQPSLQFRSEKDNEANLRASRYVLATKPGLSLSMHHSDRPGSGASSGRSSTSSRSYYSDKSSRSPSECSQGSACSYRRRSHSNSDRKSVNGDSSSTGDLSARSNGSTWSSISSVRTNDSRFTEFANQKFAEFERALEEERVKRQQAEAKLDKLMHLLEAKESKK